MDAGTEKTDRIDALLLLLAAGVSLFILFGAPFVLASGWTSIVLLLAIAVVSAPFHWALLHEAIHGHLFSADKWNTRGGRLLGVLLGYSFDAVRFGHLGHHRFNRHSLDRPEDRQGKSWRAAAPFYYFNLFFGQALGSMLGSVLFLLPAPAALALFRRTMRAPDVAPLQAAGLRYFGDTTRRWRMRLDVLLAAALFAAALWTWGPRWPLLLACLLARWMTLSILDNAPHYGTPRDSNLYAPDMRAPSWVSGVLLNGNLHGLHHAQPDLPWRELPARFAETQGRYATAWLTTVLRQFKGPMALT